MVTLPMTLGLMGIAPNFVSWFFGSEFKPVVQLLFIISPVIFFVGLANIFGVQILVSTNQQNKYAISITIGAALSVMTNILFVSNLASTATTWALLVAEGSGALLQMYFARKYLDLKYLSGLFIKYFILSIFVFLSVKIVDIYMNINPVFLTFIQLITAAFIYLLGLFLMKDSILLTIIKTIKTKVLKR
jgi:O-antigen/teichoic acid export membrane protein